MLKLFKELKRRKVLTTLGAYAAAAFVIIQLAGVVFPALRFPDWMMAFVILLIILGFPITFFLSWTYDLKREADDKLGPEDVPSVKKSNKLLLPITGFLTIIGGLFWFWYSLGDVTSGSDIDLQLGIKKTIAVFGFENLSGKKEDDHLCSGISLHIRDVLNKIGKLNVKARRFTLNNNPKVLDLDYYIDGVLSEVRGNRTIVVSIVNAKSETDLWSGQFKYNDKEILSIQDTIIKSILTELEIAPIGNEITSSAHVYKNQENFKLIGEGIYHYDKQNYTEAIKAFNSVLASDSENIVALYHKANSFFELDNFQEAMTIYKNILGQSIDIDPIQLRMSVPKRKGVHSILCENIELIEDKDLAIMLLRGDRGSRLVCFNTVSMEGVWDVDIDDPFVSSPVIINNIIYLSSNRFKKEQIGEPTLYAYNISNGKNTFIREFPRDNQDQTVLFTILEDYSNISDNNSTILLRFKKMGRNAESHRELALIETSSGGPVWEQKIEEEWGFWPDLVLINEGDLELLVLILENDIIALNNKTGNVMWRENFLGSALFLWNQKILKINQEEKYIALWDPTSRKEVWKSHDERVYAYYHKSGIIENSIDELKRRMNKDIILLNFTDGNLVAVNYDGGLFNWSRERWTRNIGFVEKIWIPENASNRVFCLTQDDTLFTINLTDGKIITRLATAGHDYRVYHDDSQNAMVLQNSEFLIGVDPINGNQLWKIKDSGVERAGLVGNSVLAAKTKLEDTLFLINAYNRDNGNLIWSKSIDISTSLSHLPSIVPICGTADCAFCSDFTFFLEHYSDKSLLLIFHDEIIKIGVIPAGNKAILQKDVRLQIARTHEKRGALDVAEEEYKLLLFQDQMNPFAHWELASLYQKKGRVNEAAKSLINYYDLILPESSEGTKTIQGLKDLKILKWNKNIPGDRFDVFKMGVDRDKIFLFINNNIETHSIYSSALIWKKSFGGENTSIISTDVKNEKYLFLIKKEVPDAKMFYLQDMLSNRRLDFEAYEKASKYFLSAMNKKDGKISWDVRLEIPGESSIVWMGVLNQKIIIQSIIQNQMLVSAYNAAGGGLLWKISRDISSLYTQYDLTLAFYKDILLLPLANSVEYINVDNGIYQGEYSDEDIDHILSFNESGIQNNTIKFFISEFENEYVEIDLDKNIKIADGLLDSDNPKMGMWINNVFIDVSTYGSVVAYELSENGGGDANVLWRDNYNTSLKLVGANEQNISLLDSNNEQIMVLDTRSGIVLQLKPLLWPGKNIEMTDRYYIVQSENKLYVVPM